MKNLAFISAVVLLLSACQKDEMLTDREFDKNMRKHFRNNEWLNCMSDNNHKKANEKSKDFGGGRSNIVYLFEDNNNYTFKYEILVGSETKNYLETGSYAVDNDKREVYFTPLSCSLSGDQQTTRASYKYVVKFIDRWELHFNHTFQVPDTQISSEGVEEQVMVDKTQTLYMELPKDCKEDKGDKDDKDDKDKNNGWDHDKTE